MEKSPRTLRHVRGESGCYTQSFSSRRISRYLLGPPIPLGELAVAQISTNIWKAPHILLLSEETIVQLLYRKDVSLLITSLNNCLECFI